MEIKIRAFRMSDLDDVVELRAMPKTQRETLQLPYLSREALAQRFESQSGNVYSLVAAVTDTGKVVGNLGLHKVTNPRRAHTAEIGMSVHDDYHGQGIGSKLMAAAIDLAENWLNITRLELTVFTDNTPAIRLYEKYGFVREGTLRHYALRDGQFVDAHMMARLRGETG
jgi:putative acetyltransferase